MGLFRDKKRKMAAVYGLCLAGACMVLYACTHLGGDGDAEAARREIAFRDIGHKLLLHAGDSTSRVLPVQLLADGEYRIRFARDFAFEPDTLVAIVEKALASESINDDYVVNVLDCTTAEAVFGFAIGKEKGSIVPCSGRLLPKSCYLVGIRFGDGGAAMGLAWLGGGMLLLSLAAVARFTRMDRKLSAVLPGDAITIGSSLFDARNKKLTINGTETALTVKESSLLLLLAESPNQVVDRARLQKELWEDQGIIVGRSLDVFISRLRKKLEGDASLRLVNIHGKGYKLEIV